METNESEMKICENLNKMLADRRTEVSQFVVQLVCLSICHPFCQLVNLSVIFSFTYLVCHLVGQSNCQSVDNHFVCQSATQCAIVPVSQCISMSDSLSVSL